MASAIREREEADRRARGVIVTHPNRDKPVVQSTRVVVVVLLLISVMLLLINTIGGWSLLEGALPIQLAFILVYLLMAYYSSRWSRGVLPLGAGLAVLLAIFALVAAPSWFDRNHAGFSQAALSSGLLGVITLLIVPVQVLLVVFAMRGFKQGWNVEVERRDPTVGGPTRPGSDAGGYRDAPPLPA
jgi:hypothetical protein